MRDESTTSGLFVSGVMHAGLLAIVVLGFASTSKFEDAQESVPVETVTQEQFNQITKGERDAKAIKPEPDKPQVAAAPQPPVRPVEKEEPQPPLRTTEAPPEPPKPKAEPPKAEPKPAPQPPERPAPPQKAEVVEPAPEPPTRPKPPEKPSEKPPEKVAERTPPERPPEKHEKPDKPKPDAIAKFLEAKKIEEPTKPAARSLDTRSIEKFISQGKASNVDTTPIGLATHNAARLSASQSAALDGWLVSTYKECWRRTRPPVMPEGLRYEAQVRVVFSPDGSLSGKPVLVNPPNDAAWAAHAESALRAVHLCNPLHVPGEYAPFFEQWRTKTFHFDPTQDLG